jgi:hypothetical protein
MVVLAKEIKGRGGRVSLRKVAEELAANGYLTPTGKRYSASAIASCSRNDLLQGHDSSRYR